MGIKYGSPEAIDLCDMIGHAIYMQSIWQTHIDASISSTVNVPNNFTVEQVEGLYMTAWEAGLKGVTIFRDGCKRAGILTTSDSKKDDETSEKPKTTLSRGMIIKADDNCVGKKRTLPVGAVLFSDGGTAYDAIETIGEDRILKYMFRVNPNKELHCNGDCECCDEYDPWDEEDEDK